MIGIDWLGQLSQRSITGLILGGLVAAAAVLLLVIVLIDPSSNTASGLSTNATYTITTDEGSGLQTITLTERAAGRLDIEVKEAGDLEIPYSALLYGLDGSTFVYISPEHLTFQRATVVVDHIQEETAVLKEGPAAGMAVVTVGAAELYGLETGIGK